MRICRLPRLQHSLHVLPVRHTRDQKNHCGHNKSGGDSEMPRWLPEDGRHQPACLHRAADPSSHIQSPGQGWSKARASLWGTESKRAIFRTNSLKDFHAYLRLLQFENCKSSPARHAMDKLGATREVWDKWAERLPRLYKPWVGHDSGRAIGSFQS